MLTVGLTGGLASGKTFVGRCLESLGCHIIRADELGHEVLQKGGCAYEAVVREFGEGILDEQGNVQRRRLAAEVFDRPDRLELLNQIVHPCVWALEERWMEETRAADPNGIAVVEAAILVETDSYKRFDKLIVAVCSEEQQIERAIKRDGLTRAEVTARLRRQMPLTAKRKYADYIVDTSGTKENTMEQTRAVYESLRRLTQA
jgi:dephospho-CoA kinase